jgi:hypothetical protein
MKWQVENLGSYCNILEDKPNTRTMEQKAIGMNYPEKVAYHIVKLHNESIDVMQKKLDNNWQNELKRLRKE